MKKMSRIVSVFLVVFCLLMPMTAFAELGPNDFQHYSTVLISGWAPGEAWVEKKFIQGKEDKSIINSNIRRGLEEVVKEVRNGVAVTGSTDYYLSITTYEDGLGSQGTRKRVRDERADNLYNYFWDRGMVVESSRSVDDPAMRTRGALVQIMFPKRGFTLNKIMENLQVFADDIFNLKNTQEETNVIIQNGLLQINENQQLLGQGIDELKQGQSQVLTGTEDIKQQTGSLRGLIMLGLAGGLIGLLLFFNKISKGFGDTRDTVLSGVSPILERLGFIDETVRGIDGKLDDVALVASDIYENTDSIRECMRPKDLLGRGLEKDDAVYIGTVSNEEGVKRYSLVIKKAGEGFVAPGKIDGATVDDVASKLDLFFRKISEDDPKYTKAFERLLAEGDVKEYDKTRTRQIQYANHLDTMLVVQADDGFHYLDGVRHPSGKPFSGKTESRLIDEWRTIVADFEERSEGSARRQATLSWFENQYWNLIACHVIVREDDEVDVPPMEGLKNGIRQIKESAVKLGNTDVKDLLKRKPKGE